MAVGERNDPYISYRFKVKIDDKDFAGFSEVSGLSFESSVETFREGGINRYERQLAGPAKYPSTLTLKRGLTREEDLWEWHQKVMDGQIVRKNVAVVLRDSAGEERWTWKFREACPVKWVGPEFRAATAEVAFETVELVHRGVEPK